MVMRFLGSRPAPPIVIRNRRAPQAPHTAGRNPRARLSPPDIEQARNRWLRRCRGRSRPRRSCRRLERHPVRPRRCHRSPSSACRRRRSSGRASRSGCSGRARSRSPVPPAADRDDLAVALERHPVRLVGAPEVGRLLAVAGEARVERAVRVVAGEREVAKPAPPPPQPTATILPSAWSATAFARSKLPKSVVCLPSPEKLVSSEPFGVVAGEREVAGAAAADRDDLAVGLERHPVRRRRRPRSRSSACRRRRSSCRATRWGCSGRARS